MQDDQNISPGEQEATEKNLLNNEEDVRQEPETHTQEEMKEEEKETEEIKELGHELEEIPEALPEKHSKKPFIYAVLLVLVFVVGGLSFMYGPQIGEMIKGEITFEGENCLPVPATTQQAFDSILVTIEDTIADETISEDEKNTYLGILKIQADQLIMQNSGKGLCGLQGVEGFQSLKHKINE